MDITEIMDHLPPNVAHLLQLKLEDCAVSTHLTPEEALNILDEMVDQLHSELVLDKGTSYLLSQVPDAVVEKIFS